MGDAPLLGKKIAVLVEHLYIPGEIETYQTRFPELGAEVHLMSRLWNQGTLTFLSDVNYAEDRSKKTRDLKLQTLDVSIDFETVKLDDYAALIVAANYVSVRLRYFDAPAGRAVGPEIAREAPAVKFFGRAMRNPRIVKGALCHGLWILTPLPELLSGRKVICHEVVIADVANAGGIYTSAADNVVVDDDLVTGRNSGEVVPFIDAIAQQIVRLEREYDRTGR